MLRPLYATAVLVTLCFPALAQDRPITGELTYMEKIALTDTAELVVELRHPDGSLAAETRTATAGAQVPLPFALTGAEGEEYALRGALILGGRAKWLTEPVMIGAGTGPLDLGTVLLAPQDPLGSSTAMRCGTTEVTVGFSGEEVQMRLRGETLTLTADPASYGARHVLAGDPATYFWGQGNAATVALRGEELPGCVAVVQATPKLFRATGNEPGWSLTVVQDQITWLGNFGSARITGRRGPQEMTERGARYGVEGYDLFYTVTQAICRDSATGMLRPATVSVETGAAQFSGCGGDPLALLTGDAWVVADIGGAAVPEGTEVSIAFSAEGSVSGNGGCNRYFGTATLTGEGFGVGGVGSTMMACPEPQMQTEQQFQAALAGVDMFDIAADGALILLSAGAPVITARR